MKTSITKKIATFLFLLIGVSLTFWVLFSLGCGLTHEQKIRLSDAYYRLGLAKLKLDETSEAKQDLQTALKLAEQTSNTQLKDKIEAKLHSLTTSPKNGAKTQPDKILRVGDKLSPFTSNEVEGPLPKTWIEGDLIFDVNGVMLKVPPTIHFLGEIKLKNGTRYICTTSEVCKVTNFVVTEGEIEVYHKNGK